MADVYRVNRKVSDSDLVRMNSVGLSLATIAKAIGCHPSTVTLRLSSINVKPADTRRSFMEDVFLTLDTDQQEWLADQLNSELSIKDFVRNLIILKFKENQGNK